MTDSPRRLADLKAGVRLREEATGMIWTIDRVVRANSYSTPWIHLSLDDPPADHADARPTERIEGAGALLDASAGWRYA